MKSTKDALNPKKELSRIKRPYYEKLYYPHASEAFKTSYDDPKTKFKKLIASVNNFGIFDVPAHYKKEGI